MTRNQRNGVLGVTIAVAAVAGMYLINGGGGQAGAGTVVLQASGGSAMDVAYTIGDRNSQDTSAASPWSVTYRVTGGMPYAGITVQNGGGDSPTVSCSITEDGQVVASNTSYGAYAVVQCSH